MRYIGLDAGSVSVKAVVLDAQGKKLTGLYRKHQGHPLRVALEVLRELSQDAECSLSITGSAGRLIAKILSLEPINEIVAQAYATKKLYPHIKTIIEIGGEDSKLIFVEDGVKDFSMNSVCAAGTGSFLDQQAERLRLSIEEFSALALRSERPPRIAGRCSVFAKSDMIHLQQIATPVEDIVAGLCFAVARNFKGTISRGRQIIEPVSFHGGVAANKAMVRAFKEVFALNGLFVPPDFALMGAWGAALKSKDEGRLYKFNLRALEEFILSEKASTEGHRPLMSKEDDFFNRHRLEEAPIHKIEGRTPAYLGIDVGSISTNLAVTDEEGRLLAKRYLMTAGRPIEAVREGLLGIAKEIADKVEIKGVGTTGSGRYMIADFVGADIVKNEITAQATATSFIDKNVDTIFEIGGQDSKYISLRDGVIVDFEMNKACAAGTGSFLEEQAEKLNISVKEEFSKCAFASETPCRLGERCTVFMENSLMANLQKGADKNDLLAGLAYSIVQNYINRVVAGKPIGSNIFFQGGVAFNKAVVAAFEKYIGKKITVPPHHDVTGAIGMALIARDYMRGRTEPTSFKGFELGSRNYSISSFECKGCPNVCEINRVKIEGEEGFLFYGGRCEKYDIRRKKLSDGIENLFALREDALRKEPTGSPKRGTIGVPYIFYFHEKLPFWMAFLREIGFSVVLSPKTNREIINKGLEHVLSESCFPVKVALGHIGWLLEKEVDAVFIPSFINVNKKGDEFPRGSACPYTQAIPYISKVVFPKMNAIIPAIDEHFLGMEGELKKVFKRYGVSSKEIRSALRIAHKAQSEFEEVIRKKGDEVLASIKPGERVIVIVGRSYNAFDKGMNLEIPEKLATFGVRSIPIDFLPLDEIEISKDWPNMYWRNGQRILKAARFISRHPNLYPVFIGNFSCGPDSFILKFFKQELGTKPFLHIEIDEHSADAGAITRCEAFLDSIDGAKKTTPKPTKPKTHKRLSIKDKIVYIPRMSDHAFALKAAFERSGISADVLPESDKEAIELAMKYVSGKECYPCAVTTGDMLKVALSRDFIPQKSAFFMPSGSGPCRFGQYNVFHKQVLEAAGFDDVPVFAPNQDVEFYKELGEAGEDFASDSWKGIVAIDLLYKCLHETRPYEREKGLSKHLYNEYLNKIYNSVRAGSKNGGSIEDILLSARKAFGSVPREKIRKPLIGVIGEIFVRSNRFSNEDLIKEIEALGGEAWLAPVEEWIYYVNYTAKRRALIMRDYSAMIGISLRKFFQDRVEHRYKKFFEGFLRTLKEPSTEEIIKKASPYVPETFEGETILSIGKSVDLAERGAAGLVNAMPFGCMPGTIVTALLRAINKRYDIPYISIPYDGTESPTVRIQLEAFMEQARTRDERQRR